MKDLEYLPESSVNLSECRVRLSVTRDEMKFSIEDSRMLGRIVGNTVSRTVGVLKVESC